MPAECFDLFSVQGEYYKSVSVMNVKCMGSTVGPQSIFGGSFPACPSLGIDGVFDVECTTSVLLNNEPSRFIFVEYLLRPCLQISGCRILRK